MFDEEPEFGPHGECAHEISRLNLTVTRQAEEIAGLVEALEAAQRAINSMKVEAETAGAGGDEPMLQDACETISNEGLEADMAIRAALAKHREAANG